MLKTVLAVFADIPRLVESDDQNQPSHGEHVRENGYFGYLFDDREYSEDEATCDEFIDSTVLIWAHKSGSKNHKSQESWIKRANPKMVFRRPSFMHDGDDKKVLRHLFVNRKDGEISGMLRKFVGAAQLDLIESTMAYNALMQFLPNSDARAARRERDKLAEEIKKAGLTSQSLAHASLTPGEWDIALRACVDQLPNLIC